MPIYEYTCQQCGHETELMHRMNEQPSTPCGQCGASSLVRQVSAAGFRLAGAGWYETDFKNSNKKNLAGDAAAAPAKTEAAPAAACGTGACAACS